MLAYRVFSSLNGAGGEVMESQRKPQWADELSPSTAFVWSNLFRQAINTAQLGPCRLAAGPIMSETPVEFADAEIENRTC